MLVLEVLYLIFLLTMLAQGVASIYFNLYAWASPGRLKDLGSPRSFVKPKTKFTVLLPAYHEEAVLGQTIAEVAKLHYPKDMFEILVILQPTDAGTIEVAEESIKENKIKNARILIVDGDHKPLNKPYQMNFALEQAKFESIVIFDSEDIVHPDILHVANTIYQKHQPDVIQCGVQLMNYDAHWFSSHNVLEYYFWFRSRMHVHTNTGVVPLGGNTVFFLTEQLRDQGGWNEQCLTEDGEIGLRLSVSGKWIYSTYDPKHVTKEETPDTIPQFVKQRTRWNQGFIQIVKGGQWKHFPHWWQRMMALYILGFPGVQAVLFFMSPLMMAIGFFTTFPFFLSVLSFIPVFLVIMLIGVQMVGLYEFTREQGLPLRWKPFLLFIPTFLPYQLLLYAGALRGSWRELKGLNNWEKTAHSGAHRTQDRVAVVETVE